MLQVSYVHKYLCNMSKLSYRVPQTNPYYQTCTEERLRAQRLQKLVSILKKQDLFVKCNSETMPCRQILHCLLVCPFVLWNLSLSLTITEFLLLLFLHMPAFTFICQWRKTKTIFWSFPRSDKNVRNEMVIGRLFKLTQPPFLNVINCADV